jgi:1-aminocyclopropane-1-carboxylate deaminase/D-cysteine desulfhydrase-like pyridoxal-dependent ACC family enzyme
MTAEFGIGVKKSWEQTLREIEESGGRPYAIPAGASDHPLGGLGFAGWAFEVAGQERELGVFFDTIVVCSVTGSTQAGMIAGFAALTRTEGMITDPVYEGKSMAGLIDLIAAARSSPPPRCSTPTSAASPHSTPSALFS